MNKQFKKMGVSLIVAFLVIGMVFAPAASAGDEYKYVTEDHFNGTFAKDVMNTSTGDPDVNMLYDSLRDTVAFYGFRGGSYTLGHSTDRSNLSVSSFGFDDASVKSVTIDNSVHIGSGTNGSLSKFVNADFYLMKGYGSFGGSYEGVEPVQYLFGDDKILHYLQPWDSNITVEHTATSTTEPAGRTTAIDTLWAFEGQKVKIAVSPASGYSVYGWNVYECGMSDGTIYKQFTPSEDYIVKSTDPEDGATTYILTMPKIEVGHSVAVEPLLRDQGSTIVTYVFLDADTYVMEVPADFNIKKMNVPVAEKMVNLTDCELLDGHVLSVDLDSYNGYRDIGLGFNTFVMQNIAGSSYAGYTIDEKKIYKNATAFSEITSNNVEILSTSGMTPVQVDEKVSEGNMKTELQFTLKGLGSYASLGKYKDQLTFTVSIDE